MMYLTAGTYLKKINWKKALEILLYCTFFNLIGAFNRRFSFNQTTAFAHIDPKGFLATVAENKLQRGQSSGFFEGLLPISL